MSTTRTKISKKPMRRNRLKTWLTPMLIVVPGMAILIAAISGVLSLHASHAATPYITLESETGTISSPAIVSRDTSASAGAAITFSGQSSGAIFSPNKLYVSSTGHAAQQAVDWQASQPADAATMRRIAAVPVAAWASDQTNAQVSAAVSGYVSQAQQAGALPVLVAYHIPGRDCSSYSAGGASSVGDYETWITNFTAGIAGRPAIVIVEPDALSELMVCLNAGQQQDRLTMLNYAVTTLKASGHTYVYLDGGNPSAQPVTTIANWLNQAGVAKADGFSINVSGFQTTAENVTYGNAVSKLIANKHYVIDTSRNGNGATTDFQFCNPPGRTIGTVPTLSPGLGSTVDALLWIKILGESDGPCNGGPASGVWWPEYALSLAQAAGW